MERTAALALTSRIEATWSNTKPWPGSRCDAWIEALCEVDEGAAGTTFARLRATHPDPPSIAHFLATARTLTTTDGGTRDKCPDCGDMGWVDAPTFVKRGVPYSAVQPCQRCTHGEQAARSTTWTNRSPA